MDIARPYLIIPKLIEQPTWGGDYIASIKGWDTQAPLHGRRIGQSYELFSGTNLSLADSSRDPLFQGELSDRDAVEKLTRPLGTVSLARLIEAEPEAILGKETAARTGGALNVLIKLTQAMGNSFQIHIKDGTVHPFWRPKPESWYYLEPGLITLGVKPDIDWSDYEAALTALDEQLRDVANQVFSEIMPYATAQEKINGLLEIYNPWEYVNLVQVDKGQLVDLSAGGLHHSWEEDARKYPLGNILYEVQLEAMDHNSTIRSFDKGKMTANGSVRSLNIKDYFELIDRTPEANDPLSHLTAAELLTATPAYSVERLLKTPYYGLDKLTFNAAGGGSFSQNIAGYRHVFAKEGIVEVSTKAGTVELTKGHSCFVPAKAREYEIKSMSGKSEILITT